ncbi:hypothetical protein AB1Y20_001712 [Prymnesium parvum]|uniref:phosphoglycerate mutase (2,3-diphosphoglycerate-independent) n=1 Tax=Prymnesium parvum TaxID=97485 RepID=A0AB34KCV0_PRYPA
MVKRALLICIDGWGERAEAHGNAILEAKTPVMDSYRSAPANYAVVDASGLSVGLPAGVMGNSEVGHLTIGAGQVEFQDLVRINLSLEDGSIAKKEALVQAFEHAKSGSGRLHLFGLVSSGGVHSHQEHLFAILAAAKAYGVPRSLIHVCLDGRDTPPTSGVEFMKTLEAKLAELSYGEIATLSGRYYSMDRDKRWERVKLGYDCICRAPGSCETVPAGEVSAFLSKLYEKGETDEFVKPVGVLADGGLADGETFLCFNFRSDRAREMFEAMCQEPPFETDVKRKPGLCVQFTRYNSSFDTPIVFPPQKLKNGLSEWISAQGLTQFHCAETEKYAHVTFFFNGGREEAFEGEERCMVDSPKVATYDLQPEMSAVGVADAMVAAVKDGKHPFMVCNFAPPDMVGHTGVYEKAVIAAAHTDEQIGKIAAACQEHDVGLFITSDHGNCETMITEDGKPITSHSTTPVPFIGLLPKGDTSRFKTLTGGVADVAPTVLAYMGLPIPSEMTGKSML